MRIALAQMEVKASMELNLKKSVEMIEEVSRNKADLILFPEVQLSEFFPQYEHQEAKKYLLTMDSLEVDLLKRTCSMNKIWAVPNIYLLEGDKAYDASILIDRQGHVRGIQKMVHVAQAEHFYEQDYYIPSDDGFFVFDTEFGKIGIVVCFDRHYPESIRTETLMGADLILIPTVNTKEEPSEMFEWELRVQAFHNSVVIAMANRVGREDNMNFSGESIVVDAKGEVLIKADDREQIVYVDLDLEQSGLIRASKNYTKLRRVELYR